MTQAKGSASQVLLDFETAYGQPPAAAAALVMPFFYTFGLGGEEPLKSADIHRNDRNAAQPYYDNHDVKGSISVPIDVLNFGYWLRLLLGAPVTTRPTALALDNGPAVDVGGGVVGLPCTGHALAAGTPLQVANTVHYNGHYTVLASSTANQINITATYVAETFSDAINLDSGEAAVDVGGGVVGLPCTGHGLLAGTAITIANTVNYDGDYLVLASSGADQINITAAYQAETFGLDDTATPASQVQSDLYTHVFKPAASLESALIDKGFTNINQYFLYKGIKVNKLGFAVEGKGGPLTATIDLLGAKETLGGVAYDANPTEYALTNFQMRQATIKEGGATVATVKTVSLDIDNSLDGDTFVVGDGGVRGALNEGDCLPSGKLKVMFENDTLYNKAVAGTESSLEIILASGLYSLTFLVPELLYSRKSPEITKGGVWLETDFQGYYQDSAEAAGIVATLVNTHPAYA
ncbi:MAG: phage tail tube protein [Deltaproteobacteria bacterium]|nr:phage tail tube protein [Deltaproteobacteria bacterium]